MYRPGTLKQASFQYREGPMSPSRKMSILPISPWLSTPILTICPWLSTPILPATFSETPRSSRRLAVVKPAVLVVMAVLDVAGVVPRGLEQVGTEDGEIHKSVTLLQSGSGSSRGQNRSKLKNLS